MKINTITICNFKNFRGEHTIDMTLNNKDNENNIILIGGVNGSGKTTILESIRLCMFGKRFNGSILSNKDYENYLISAKNKSSIRDNDKRFFIQIEVEIDNTFPTYSITLKRDWVLSNNGKINNENFTIFRDGVPLEIIPEEYWEDYIISLFPPYITNHFFFDGERIKELAVGNNADEILRESIRDLTGLKLYETLADDLSTLKSKIRRRNIDRFEIQTEIREKEGEILTIKNELNKIENDIEEKSSNITELNNRKKGIEENLRRKAGAFAEEREKNENTIFKLKEELNGLNNEIKYICEDSLPFIIASKTCENLLEQLEVEKKRKELIASEHILKEINQKFIKRIESNKRLSKLPEKEFKVIKNEIKNIFSEMFIKHSNESEGPLIHDLTNTEMAKIENFLKKIEINIKRRFNKILKRREEKLIQIRKIKDRLKNIPDEGFVKDYIDELSSIRTEIEVFERDIPLLKSKNQNLNEKKNELENAIKELEEKIVCIEEDHRKLELSTGIEDSLQEFIDRVISSNIEELARIITSMYRKLANKEDMVKEIKIDAITFSTSLVDFEGKVVNKESISTGEKEIYALCVLWGLAKISNKKPPIVMDSPLAKLDKSHVGKIIDDFFPNAGDQVIILSHDREIDQELYQRLKPHINKAYTLSPEEENKINKGYFFD